MTDQPTDRDPYACLCDAAGIVNRGGCPVLAEAACHPAPATCPTCGRHDRRVAARDHRPVARRPAVAGRKQARREAQHMTEQTDARHGPRYVFNPALVVQSPEPPTRAEDGDEWVNTVTTPDELDALPIGAVVVDRDGDAWQHRDDGTIDYGGGAQFDAPPGWFLARPGQDYDVVRPSASMAHFGPFTVAWQP